MKQFLLQFDDDAQTKWLVPDPVLTEVLAELFASAGRTQSEGSVPRVTVHAVEKPEGGRQGQLVILKIKEGITR